MSNATVVGADAHIGPAECTAFMELFGESVTSRRVDVGIARYAKPGDFRESRTDVMKQSENLRRPPGFRRAFALFSLQDIFYGRQLHFAQVADSAHELGTPGEKIIPVG